MASVLFGAQACLAVLPLMLFHQMQLMVCAVLAKRFAASAASAAPEPAVAGAAAGSAAVAETAGDAVMSGARR